MASFATTSQPRAAASSESAAATGHFWAWAGVIAAVLGVAVTWCVQFALSNDVLNAGSPEILPRLNTSTNEALWRISSGAGYIVVAALIVFAVGLRRLLEARDGGRSIVPSVIFGSILVTAAGLAISMAFRAQVFDGMDAYAADPASHVTINRLSQDTVLASWAALLAGSVATAYAGIGGRIFPKWLGWMSAVLSVAIAGLCLVGGAFPANMPALLWLVTVAVWATRQSAEQA